jgi:uncharacterized protein (TIGR03435 family)
MTRRLLVVGAVAIPAAMAVVTAPRPWAQEADQPVAFEVASIKPNDGSRPGQGIRVQPGGLFNVVNMPLRALITFAYQLQSYQLVGAPDWANDDRWDIVAKFDGDPPVPPPGSPGAISLATRTLLADRFKLVVHRETREQDIYALTMAQPGGTPGPELKPAAQDCSPEGLAARKAAPPGTLEPIFCGIRAQGPGRIAFTGMPLSFYATFVAGAAGRYVVDRTGLEGRWDFNLTWAPEPPAGQLPPGGAAPPIDENRPHLFTALQEQLGLKLEAAKGPVEVLVIDSVQRPDPD